MTVCERWAPLDAAGVRAAQEIQVQSSANFFLVLLLHCSGVGVDFNETVGRWPRRIPNQRGLERLIARAGVCSCGARLARRYTAPKSSLICPTGVLK